MGSLQHETNPYNSVSEAASPVSEALGWAFAGLPLCKDCVSQLLGSGITETISG
jgi:hypothetical protein